MATFKTSMTTEVRSMFKEFLDGLKLSTEPLEVFNAANTDSDAHFSKEGASSEEAPLLQGNNGSGTHSKVPPPMV